MIRIHQVLATLGYGDAIGHEVLGIQRVLREARATSRRSSSRRPITGSSRRRATFASWSTPAHPDNLLLHHFSLGSKASRTAYALPDRMALIYHNITPPEYFVGVHRTLARQCFRGRRELQAYADRCDLAIGDSEFNRQDLEALGFPRTAVLPVVPDFSHLDREPDWLVARDFDDDWTNIVFVGRVIANKKIEDLIRWFHAYHTIYNPRSRLLLVGAQSGFERYLASLHQLVGRLGASHVHFVGHVSDEELVAFYEIADLFLCASEHEGFCVPIVEAFYKQVPVLAYAATAVPSTMDGAGVLFDGSDPLHVARADGRHRLGRRPAGSDRRRPARGRRSAALEGLRRHAARLRRPDPRGAARAPRRTSRSTSGDSSTPRRSSRSSGCIGRRSIRRSRHCQVTTSTLQRKTRDALSIVPCNCT